MESSNFRSNEQKIASWVSKISSKTKVLVSNYCYNCLISNTPKEKTLIAFPQETKAISIIAIDKPIDQVELIDVLKLYTIIKSKV